MAIETRARRAGDRRGGRAHVRQLLLNLLLNALDASSEGGRISVGVAYVRPSHAAAGPERTGWLAIRVADTGCGLPAELGVGSSSPS